MTNPKSERGGRTPFPRYPPFTAPCKSTGNPGVGRFGLGPINKNVAKMCALSSIFL